MITDAPFDSLTVQLVLTLARDFPDASTNEIRIAVNIARAPVEQATDLATSPMARATTFLEGVLA